jgi:arabinofuranosyltransferase
MNRRRVIIQFLIITILVLFLGAVYLIWSSVYYRIGFPLDDAWIHLVYARNLALSGSWSFQNNDLTAGSTAPLWTMILALAFWITNNPYCTAFVTGIASLIGLAYISQKLSEEWIRTASSFPLVGVFIAAEWHLTWASVSGMETIFFCFMVMLFFYNISRTNSRNWFTAGIIAALATWTRPDGITLLLPVGLMWMGRGFRKDLLIKFFIGWLPLAIAYIAFNQCLGGHLWPNTFYAKQMEYAILQSQPILTRLSNALSQPFIGPATILIPGLLFFVAKNILKKDWLVISCISWVLVYILIYALLLAVTYQHGRYIIPVIPMIIVIGLLGTQELAESILSRRVQNLTRFSIRFLCIGLLFVFSILGAITYARDVSIIETQMVEMATWISENAPENAQIAAHDIGALGYFGERRIIDLGGLIQTNIIPFMRDEAAISNYLSSQNVDYLMTFPAWYPTLVNRLEIVYISEIPSSMQEISDPMTLYLWNAQ